MSDAEIVAGFMEAMPALPDYWTCTQKSRGGWWELVAIAGGSMRWYPLVGSLDRLHIVEERALKEFDWFASRYEREMGNSLPARNWRPTWHADAPTRIRALAQVLRATVEGAADAKK